MSAHNYNDTELFGPRWRRGLATGETIVLLVAGAVLTTASFSFVPQALQGMTAPSLPPDEPPRAPELLVTFDAVRALMATSHRVVAAHRDDLTGLTHVVIWHEDTDLDGAMDPAEILVLTHSGFLGQITAVVIDWQPSPGDPDFTRLTAPIAVESAQSPGFAQLWRSREGVTSAPVAVGVEEFRLDRLGGRFDENVWRVEVRWSRDVSDANGDRLSSFVVAPEVNR